MKNIIKCLGTATVVLAICLILSGAGYDSETVSHRLIKMEIPSPIKPYEYTYYNVPLTDEQQRKIQIMAKDNNIPYEIVLGIMHTESNFNPDAIGDNGNSIGIMQIQPKWHQSRMKKLAVSDLTDTLQCASVGIDYLSDLTEKYGNLEKALVAYNAGYAYTDSNEYSQKVMEYAVRL